MNLNSSPKVEPEVIRAAVYGKITPRRMHNVVSARFAASTFFLPALQLLHLLLMNVASRVTLPPRLLPYYSFAAGLSSIRP